VRVWDVESGETLKTLHGHTEPVWSVAFTPNGSRVASASLGLPGKGEVKLWDPATGRDALTLDGNGAVAFSADGRRLVGLNVDLFQLSSVTVWDAGPVAEPGK
jgi:WD40 repeat protein